MKIVKINASEYGLEESKAKEIKKVFTPMLDKMESLEKDYNSIIKLEMSEDTCLKAKNLRLQYVKVRTGTAKIHKELKQFYLQGGRFVDGLKNAQIMASQGIEESLTKIENHYANLEKERIIQLQERREKDLQKFEVDYIPLDLGEMGSTVWENYLIGVRVNYKTRIDAEKKAEQQRIDEDRINKLKNLRYNAIIDFYQWWTDGLKNTNLGELKESEFKNIRKILIQEKSDYDEKQAEIRLTNQRLEAEAKEAQRKEKAAQEKRDKEAQAELEKRQLLEAKLREKAEDEERQRLLKEAEIQADMNKKDTEKVTDFIADLDNLKSKYTFTSQKNKQMYRGISVLIDNIINQISSATERNLKRSA